MCKTGPHFKLCTCSDLEVGSHTWELTTGNTEIFSPIVGSFMCPPQIGEAIQFDSIHFILKRLKFDLNNTDAFDFEYHPHEGDMIKFHFPELYEDPELDEDQNIVTLVYSDGEFDHEGLGRDYGGGKRLASGDLRYVPKPGKNPGTNPDSSTSTPRMPGFLKDFSSK